MESTTMIFGQVQTLVAPLNAKERLALIQVIAAMPSIRASPPPLTPAQRHAQLAQEQAGWYALAAEERSHYRGEYVALHQGQVVDHDPKQRVLYIRIRERYGHAPVPILYADWEEPPTYIMHSPHLG